MTRSLPLRRVGALVLATVIAITGIVGLDVMVSPKASAASIGAYLQVSHKMTGSCSFTGVKLGTYTFTVRDPSGWQMLARTSVTRDALAYIETTRSTYNGVSRYKINSRCVKGRVIEDWVPTKYVHRTYTKVTWMNGGGIVSVPWWTKWTAGLA